MVDDSASNYRCAVYEVDGINYINLACGRDFDSTEQLRFAGCLMMTQLDNGFKPKETTEQEERAG